MLKLLKSRSSIFVALLLTASASAAEPIDYNRDIRPLLSDKCFLCHGPDASHREADLRLDLQEKAHGTAIKPGDAEASEVFQRITCDEADLQMPPPDSGKSLKPEEIELLRQWINDGAEYSEHWAFTPPKRQTPEPAQEWGVNEIDAFIRRKLAAAGLQPSPEATKTQLLRRVTLDLTGLPPTISETDAFLDDKSDNAYEKVVDRLLKSETFGERMAVEWLDAARYADTMGYQADWERYQWRWRSWVIDAYNRNLPFDQFTIEQLAGDLLDNPSTEQLIATGFNRNHRINDEGGVIPEEYLVEYIVDRVETTSATWLGLTMGCARCHDHKYDPISQVDFYQLYAFFNGVPEKGKAGRQGYADPYMRVAVRGKQEAYEAAKQSVADAQTDFDRAVDGIAEHRAAWIAAEAETLPKQLTKWQPLKFASIKGKGVAFKRQRDGSYLGSRFKNDHPEYEITFQPTRPGTGLTGLKLEALTDKSLSGGRLSLQQGNFYLTDFSVAVRSQDNSETPVKISTAQADYEQEGHPVSAAIDDDAKSSWAVDGHAKKEARAAAFAFGEPITPDSDQTIVVRLRFDSPHPGRVIGRLRLSQTTASQPRLRPVSKLPDDVVTAIVKPAARRTAADQKRLRDYHASIADEVGDQRRQLADAKNSLKTFEDESTTYVMVMREMETPRPTHVLKRGVYNKPGDLVTAAVPEKMLGSLPESSSTNRLGLAKWLVSGQHPLTARVIVNRYWAMLFGRGIVSTLEDFGMQGAYPSHPELLDWLATEYPRIGWDTKQLLKMMVMSATYRQDSKVTDRHRSIDPQNILLARAGRLRLPAEMIRDQALAASGLLVRKIGGASVKPYQPDGLWSELSFASKNRTTDFYIPSTGEGLYRRSLYTFWKRSVPPPTMATFDAPSRESCVLQRSRTNTPMQALALMNDVTYVEASRRLAESVMTQKNENPEAWIRTAFRRLLTRSPTQRELQLLLGGFARRHEQFATEASLSEGLLSLGETQSDESLNRTNLAALTTSILNILNLDETVNRE